MSKSATFDKVYKIISAEHKSSCILKASGFSLNLKHAGQADNRLNITVLWIFQQPMLITISFNFLDRLPVTNESLRTFRHKIKLFYITLHFGDFRRLQHGISDKPRRFPGPAGTACHEHVATCLLGVERH